MNFDWLNWLPGKEFLLVPTVLVPFFASVVTVACGLIERKIVRIGLMTASALAGLVTNASVEQSKAKPSRDYAYLFVPRSELIDGTVQVFVRSTGFLDGVRICGALTKDYLSAPNVCLPGFGGSFTHDLREGAAPVARLPVGDFTFDVDAKSMLGAIRQTIKVAIGDDGKAMISTKAWRKETNEVLCELPQRAGVKPCL